MEHGSGAFCTVDSYTDVADRMTYEDIPIYDNQKRDSGSSILNNEFPLYDVYDFRPRVEDIAGTSSDINVVDEITGNSFDITSRKFASTGASANNWPKPGSIIQSDFEHLSLIHI